MSSKIKSIAPMDFNTRIVVNSLPSPLLINSHYERIKEIYPNKTENEINVMLNNVILRDIIFGTIMDHIASLYEFEFSKEDIDRMISLPWIKEHAEKIWENQPNISLESIQLELAQQEIRKILLYDELIREFDIGFDDQEFDTLIKNYYEDTNLSIREWKKNQEARESAKRSLLNEKLVNTVIKSFNNIDTKPYFERLEEMNKLFENENKK